MNRYKSSIIALIASTVFIGSSLTINAYLNDANLKLSRIADKQNNVSLQIEDVNNMVKSFSISLALEDATLNNIEWSSEIKSNAKANFIKNDDNTVDIYVTSNEDLVNEEGNLEIGKINVNGNIGDTYNVSLNNNKKSIKLVTTNNKEVISNNVEVTGDKNFTISEIKTPDNNDNIKDPDTDEPTVDKPSIDNPSEDIPSEDKPSTDKPSEITPPVNKPEVDTPSEDIPAEDEPTVDNPSIDKPIEDDTTDKEEEDKPENDIEEVIKPDNSQVITTPSEEELNKSENTKNEIVEESNSNNSSDVTENIKSDKDNSKTGDTSLRNIVFLIGLGITSIMTILMILYNKFSYKGKH